MPEAPTYFATPAEWRGWLEQHADSEREVLVGFRKKGSGLPSITWPESVDEALCVGWIDGVRRRIDDTSYSIRFTPRKPGSIWSAVNVARVAELTTLGRMRPAGVAAFERRREDRTAVYAYEREHPAQLEAAEEQEFRDNAPAWEFFSAQAPWYRRTATAWVLSAKRADTRRRRLNTLIADSAAGRRLAGQDPGPLIAGRSKIPGR